jgi:hypothetical protein
MKGNFNKLEKSLFLIPDWSSWTDARQWTYLASYLTYKESLNVINSEIQIVPCRGGKSNFLDNNEIEYLIEKITDNKKYNFIFIWLPYLDFKKKIFDKLLRSSRKIIVFITESLLYLEKDYKENPSLNTRWQKNLDILDHINPKIISCCRVTSEFLSLRNFDVYFTYSFIPESKITFDEYPKADQYFLAATLYNDERRNLFFNLKKTLTKNNFKQLSYSDDKKLVSSFEIEMNKLLKENDDLSKRALISQKISNLRFKIWINYLKKISEAKFIFTLPSYFKGIPGICAEACLMNRDVYFLNSNLEKKDIKFLINNKNFSFYSADEIKQNTIFNKQKLKQNDMIGFSKFSHIFNNFILEDTYE